MDFSMREFFSAAVRSHARLIGPSLIALALVSCGGGGGGGGSTSCPGGFLTCNGTGTDGGTTTQTPKVTMTLVDAGTGVATNNLTSGKPLTVRAVLVSATGLPLANRVVTFSTNSSLAIFDPASGTRLTDANGLATINLLAADLASSGAAEVTATVDVDGASVTQKIAYAVSPGSVTLSNLSANSSSLSAYGSTSVSVQVFFNGALTTTPLTVNFSSGCDSNGKASITRACDDQWCCHGDLHRQGLCRLRHHYGLAAGNVRSDHDFSGCPKASNISYVSANPSSMALAGYGRSWLSSSSVVTFKVVDSTNNPVASKLLSVLISPLWVGASSLNNQSLWSSAGNLRCLWVGECDGLCGFSTYTGMGDCQRWLDDPTLLPSPPISPSLRAVRLRIASPFRSAPSTSKAGTGMARRPSANVHAFDRLGNPVADGTVVNFISEGAGIQPSCVTASGACSVTVTSGEFRPRADSEPSSFFVKAGRMTILAYAQGEESFDDLNQNNIYDLGEVFRDLGDAFVDDNTEN
jgi:hypothetical protein